MKNSAGKRERGGGGRRKASPRKHLEEEEQNLFSVDAHAYIRTIASPTSDRRETAGRTDRRPACRQTDRLTDTLPLEPADLPASG